MALTSVKKSPFGGKRSNTISPVRLPFLLWWMFTRDLPRHKAWQNTRQTLKRIVTAVKCVKATEEELERLQSMRMHFDVKIQNPTKICMKSWWYYTRLEGHRFIHDDDGMEYSNSKKKFRKAQKLDPRLPDADGNLGCRMRLRDEWVVSPKRPWRSWKEVLNDGHSLPSLVGQYTYGDENLYRIAKHIHILVLYIQRQKPSTSSW